MDNGQSVSIFVAFLAGVLSFLSPCLLPLLPSYLCYITGVSFEDLKASKGTLRTRVALHSVLFIIGFSLIFITLGASITFAGKALAAHQGILRKVGGVAIVLFGLEIMGILKLGFLDRQKSLHIKTKPLGYLGSLIIGAIFALGWTPCVGAILASILVYASTTQNLGLGIILLMSYSLGLGVPFFLSSIAQGKFLWTFDKIKRYIGVIEKVSGVILILLGLALFTGYLENLSAILGKLFANFFSKVSI